MRLRKATKWLTAPLLALMLCGCQLQINLASSVVNVPVSKTQVGDNPDMSGSSLKDLKNDGQKGGEIKVPLVE